MEKTYGDKESLEALARRIYQGDLTAETELVLRYSAALMAVLINSARDTGVAEEVAQDTWIIVLEKLRSGEVRDPSKLSSFIRQVGKNQLIMYFRRGQKSALNESIDDRPMESSALTPEQELQNKQLGDCMDELMGELKQERDKEILIRFYLTQEDKQQLCKEFDLTAAHFDRVIFRARERFRNLWKQKAENLRYN